MTSSFPLESAMYPRSANLGWVRVLLVKVSVPASVERVPVVGSVTSVAPVVVKVRELLPEVMNALARVRLPARFTVRAASFNVRVKVLPAARFSVLASVRSNAPVPVERIPRDVRASAVPPLISGEVRVLLVNVVVLDAVIKPAPLTKTLPAPLD